MELSASRGSPDTGGNDKVLLGGRRVLFSVFLGTWHDRLDFPVDFSNYASMLSLLQWVWARCQHGKHLGLR